MTLSSTPTPRPAVRAAGVVALLALYYVMALDSCRVIAPRNKKPPVPDPPQKYLRAIDIETGKIAWENALAGSTDSKRWAGVLATAGGLLFYGDPVGNFAAVDATVKDATARARLEVSRCAPPERQDITK